jgi:hypothetical protein
LQGKKEWKKKSNKNLRQTRYAPPCEAEACMGERIYYFLNIFKNEIF